MPDSSLKKKDVAFNEDSGRKNAINAAENFSVVTRLALNIIKTDTSIKASVKRKRKKAGCDDDFLEQLLINSKIWMRLPPGGPCFME